METITRTIEVKTRRKNKRSHAAYTIEGNGIDIKVNSQELLHKRLCDYLIPYVYGIYNDFTITIVATKTENEGDKD